MPGEPAAFMCYAGFDDQEEEARLARIRDRLTAEVRAQTGQKFAIFMGRDDLSWGDNWRKRIDETLDEASLLLVLVTPGLFGSVECRAEVARFVERERALGRSDLILPLYYIRAREMEDPELRRTDPLARLLSTRHCADWRDQRHEADSPLTRKTLARLAEQLGNALLRQAPAAASPSAQQSAPPAQPSPPRRVPPGITPQPRRMTIEIGLGPGAAPGRFRVEVVRSPAGEASAEVALDVGSLLDGRAEFEQALGRQEDGERRVRETGQALFGALFGWGDGAALYRASTALADAAGEELRIVLRLDTPELAELPWEAMYDSGLGGYVCRQHQLVRHVPVATVPPPLTVRLPLRVLGVVSAPDGLPTLNAAAEREQLTRALSGLTGAGQAELAWAPSATWDALQEILLDGPWHVVHFIGHGTFSPQRGEGLLALTGADRGPRLVEASRFTDLLRLARPMPRLVVLNSCSGATSGTDDLFAGTAAALTRSGVPAVAAMQYPVTDRAALAFARGFYPALARGRGVDEAVSAGRVAILGTGGPALEWLTPVLYLRGDDARLFTIPAS